MSDQRSFHVSAGVALGADSMLRCQVGTPDAVEFFWQQRHDDFDLVFTPPALREFMRQAGAALDAVELFASLDEREQEYGEFRIAQGEQGRVGSIEELRRRPEPHAGNLGGDYRRAASAAAQRAGDRR